MGRIVMRLSKIPTDGGTEWRIASHSCSNAIDQLPEVESTESKPEFVDVDGFLTTDCENDVEEIGDPLEGLSPMDVSTLRMMEPVVLLGDCFSADIFDEPVYVGAPKVCPDNSNGRRQFEDDDDEDEVSSFIYLRNTCPSSPASGDASVHSNRNPFTCDTCSARFTKECNLRRHQKMAHGVRRVHRSSRPEIFHSVFSRRLKLSSLLRYKTRFYRNNPFGGQPVHRRQIITTPKLVRTRVSLL